MMSDDLIAEVKRHYENGWAMKPFRTASKAQLIVAAQYFHADLGTALDHIAALEARNQALEDVWDAACGVIGVKQQDGSYRVPPRRMQALMDTLNALGGEAT